MVGGEVSGDGHFPLVAVGEQLLLVVQELLVGLGGELEVGSLHDGVHGTGLLAEPAVDALGHVDVVPRRPPTAILTSFGLGDKGWWVMVIQ